MLIAQNTVIILFEVSVSNIYQGVHVSQTIFNFSEKYILMKV